VGALDYYLDASFLVALLTPEPFSDRAADFVRLNPAILTVSDFAAAEFAAAVGRRVRTKQKSARRGDEGSLRLRSLAGPVRCSYRGLARRCRACHSFLRRLDLPLRTPDAIHIAAVQRIGATLVSFDLRMVANARALGVPVADA